MLLLEAGSTDWNPYIHLPVCYYKTTKGRLTWDFELAPQAHQDGITPIFTQARVLGGGSSINAQVYIRGVAADYDDWEQTGCPGWGFRDVLPYFRRAEGNERLAGEFHGTDGPLGVSDQRHTHLLSKAFVQACQEFGMPYNADFNGKVQAARGSIRSRTAMADAAARRSPISAARASAPISTYGQVCRVQRIVVEKQRAVGVECVAARQRFSGRPEQEIVLAAGAINSPKLLMLSGIGPAGHLSSHGIDVRVDLPGVGQNLHDHLDIFMMYNVKNVETMTSTSGHIGRSGQACNMPSTAMGRSARPLSKAVRSGRRRISPGPMCSFISLPARASRQSPVAAQPAMAAR